MKKTIISLIFSVISLLILSLIFSVIISILQYNKSIKINNVVIQIISMMIFLIAGIVRGIVNKKQGLLGSLPFILVYMLCFIIIKSNNSLIFALLKCLTYMIGSIIGVNLTSIKTK